MPHVTVHVYADLRQYFDGKAEDQVDVTDGQTVRDLLSRAGIPGDHVHIILVNHRVAGPDHILTPGERLDLFSAIGGG
jgi:sulfur carrier protein ThiS